MRVRISYGIEIEEIPDQAQDLGHGALEKIREALDTLSRALDNIEESQEDYSLVLEMLESVRLKLTKTDLIMTDLQAILEGLNNYYKGEQNVSERRPTMDPSGNAVEETEDNGQG